MSSQAAVNHGTNHTAAHHLYQPQVLTKTPQQVTGEVLERTRTTSSLYWFVLAGVGTLFLMGIIAFIVKLADEGLDKLTPWSYYAATAAWLLTIGSTAPVFAITQRMLKSHWRRPLSRASELFAVVGVLAALMYIPLIVLLPSSASRRTIWFQWPGTPFWPDLLAVIFLAVLGLALLYVSLVPDLAACRDHDGTFRQRWAKRLVPYWRGTDHQWKVLRAGLGVLGGLYFMMVIYVHTLVAADFAEALVPGWKDAILPTYHALSGLQSAVAITIVTLYLLRRFGGFKDYIHTDQFWGASKILLALSLLWMYFWFSGFIVFWYGRQPAEQNILRTFMFQAYKWPFILSVIFNFGIPFTVLIWNFVRKSMAGPTIVAVSILIGTLFDRIRIYVASFTTADLRADVLTTPLAKPLSAVPSPHWPGATDILVILGGIGGLVFLYMVAIKLVPALSIWEVSEGLLYRKTKTFLKRTIMVMGKPE